MNHATQASSEDAILNNVIKTVAIGGIITVAALTVAALVVSSFVG